MNLFEPVEEIIKRYHIPRSTLYLRISRNVYRTNAKGDVYVLDVEADKSLTKYTDPNRKVYKRGNDGYVYIIKLDKFYKIGMTGDPSNRFVEFTKLPFELEEICVEYVKDNRKIESMLHKKYADYRVRGEWFELSAEQVKEIVNYILSISMVPPDK